MVRKGRREVGGCLRTVERSKQNAEHSYLLFREKGCLCFFPIFIAFFHARTPLSTPLQTCSKKIHIKIKTMQMMLQVQRGIKECR